MLPFKFYITETPQFQNVNLDISEHLPLPATHIYLRRNTETNLLYNFAFAPLGLVGVI